MWNWLGRRDVTSIILCLLIYFRIRAERGMPGWRVLCRHLCCANNLSKQTDLSVLCCVWRWRMMYMPGYLGQGLANLLPTSLSPPYLALAAHQHSLRWGLLALVVERAACAGSDLINNLTQSPDLTSAISCDSTDTQTASNLTVKSALFQTLILQNL